jgi:hypothetical protein
MKGTLLASAGTKEDFTRLINDFYCSEHYIITDDNKVYNTKLNKILSTYVEYKRGRYRFMMS